MQHETAVSALAALAHPVRLEVFRALVVVGRAGLSAGTIQQGVGVPAATLSFHLKELIGAGLVTQQRAGRSLVYRAAFDQMDGLLAYLTQNCCAADTSGRGACRPATGACHD